eukprot:131900-Hanusia_phi.AAC.2
MVRPRKLERKNASSCRYSDIKVTRCVQSSDKHLGEKENQAREQISQREMPQAITNPAKIARMNSKEVCLAIVRSSRAFRVVYSWPQVHSEPLSRRISESCKQEGPARAYDFRSACFKGDLMDRSILRAAGPTRQLRSCQRPTSGRLANLCDAKELQ